MLLQRIFSIPADFLLITFLKFSQKLSDFYEFDTVLDASKFTRFKQDFLLNLQSMFGHLVDLTEPVCQKIDSIKASMALFDTSGIEAWVTENNPKYANQIIKQLKAFKKAKQLDDSMLLINALTAPCLPIQQMYINGHFCYAYKFSIVRDISFYNKSFLDAHPDIIIGKKSNSPDEDKSLADSKALIPVLKDFFETGNSF